ncbi:MAG: hypothetical protein GY869_27360, partial [Planctomycetes bacterium]|nr:hypothetical protein [Planctomycetota bacterium]
MKIRNNMIKCVVLVLLVGFMGRPASADDDKILIWITNDIIKEAQKLQQATLEKTLENRPSNAEINATLDRLQLMLNQYRRTLAEGDKVVVIEEPVIVKPPTNLVHLGTTAGAKDSDAVIFTDAATRRIPFRKIKFEHVAGDEYVRFGRIEIINTKGETLGFHGGGGKFTPGTEFEVELARPEFISEIRIRVQHRTFGVRITGTPAPPPVVLPTVMEMGRSNGVKDGPAIMNTRLEHRKIRYRKLMLKHTGGDEYVRLRDLLITTVEGIKIPIDIPAGKFDLNRVLEVNLPEPILIRSVSVRVQHR